MSLECIISSILCLSQIANSGIPLLFHEYSALCSASHFRYERPFPCARLRNLPFDASLEDILILFQGLVVIDVVLIGQGEAFVIFANPMDYQMALQR